MNAISLGEVLWDVIGEEEHLGGAPFNFSAHLARLGHTVNFVSAVGNDERGDRVVERMSQMGLSREYLSRTPEYPTGIAPVSFLAGQPRYEIQHPVAYDFPSLSDAQLKHLLAASPDWIYFGTLQQMSAQAKQLTFRMLGAAGTGKRFYDVNLRQKGWQPGLIRELIAQATVVKLNDEEMADVAAACGLGGGSIEDFCRAAAAAYHLDGVCVTRGPKGCAALINSAYLESPGYRVTIADTVGAGDAFAAAFVHAWSSGWEPARICDFANRVGALVASRAGAIPPWTVTEVLTLHRS
jgi:fructokinase